MSLKSSIVIVLCCVFCCCTCAAFAGTVDEDYDTVKALYDAAEKDPGHAVQHLSDLVEYYTKTEERKLALDGYLDAKMHFYYASARIELTQGNYAKASEYLHKCGAFGHKTEVYRCFAQGMQYKAAGFYKEALSLLQEIRTDPEVSAMCVSAIEECETAYKTELLAQAELFCKGGDHAAALECYSQLVERFPWDISISIKQKECEGHGTPNPGVISLINAFAVDATTISLEWQGTMSEYTVTWTMDWSDKAEINSLSTKETNCRLTGLNPGTQYKITIGNESLGVSEMIVTKEADKYTEKVSDFKWMGTSAMYRFSREKFIATGKPSYFMLEFNPEAVKDKAIIVYEDPIENKCILLVFPTLGVPSSMNQKPYQILLHIEGYGTLSAEGLFGDAAVCANKDDRICILLDTLLDEAVSRYANLTDVQYRVDLIIDQAMVVQASGVIK